MKYSPIHQTLINCSSTKEVFDYLATTLNDSITYWDYFVNWNKVFENIKDFEVDLNTLNYLIGKEDIETEFKRLIKRNNSLVNLIPVLLACREKEFKILTDFTSGVLKYESFSFSKTASLPEINVDKISKFAKETGLLDLFKMKKIKSIPDYVIGVEVGLDSNGRKNRGGTTMEHIVEQLLKPMCKKHDWAYMRQATAEKVKEKWNLSLAVDKSSRRFDFAINNNGKLILIETNYYGGGGSKLKATAGEYKTLFDYVDKQGHKFIWITDGLGWKSTLRPLEETFNHIDYLLNLKMVTIGLLEKVLSA